MGFLGGTRFFLGEESICQCRRHSRCGFDPWVREIPWSRKWQPTPVFLLGKFHGQRSLVGYSPWWKWKPLSRVWLFATPWTIQSMGFSRPEHWSWVAIPFSRGSSQPRDWTLQADSFYQLSQKGSPRILKWVAYPFSSRSSRPRNWSRVSCISGRVFTSWATREAHTETQSYKKSQKWLSTHYYMCWDRWTLNPIWLVYL